MNADLNGVWPMRENLAYTNSTLSTAGIGGFPLGDLYHWWPEKFQQWKIRAEAEKDTIDRWLNYGFGSVTGVSQESLFPAEFKLYQNYPNPFNPTTTICYRLPATIHLSIKIYDLLGREMVKLFDGIRQAGDYSVIFDGKDLSSGIYFYQIKAGNFIKSKKLVLLK